MYPSSGSPGLLSVTPVFVAYVFAFGVAAVACFVGVVRAQRIDDADTRRGLVALLLTSGGWAAAHVGFLIAPTPELKFTIYQIGLIVGLSTVGPWLYFCSAYTGRSLHRASVVRRVAIGVFLLIVAVKLTNPWHGLYFRMEFVTTPFPHLAVHHLSLHWIVMGLAYALAIVGYFMLVELFWQVGRRTTPLVVLISLTALPIGLNILGTVLPGVLDLTYEPLGVAAFAVGLLFIYLEDFQTIQLAGDRDDPVIVLTDDDRVRDYNRSAEQLFPDLEIGVAIDAIVPDLEDSILDEYDEESILQVDRIGGMRYYQVTTSPFTTGGTQLGAVVALSDVTEREKYRAELERQNERLEQFASMVSHDLRNPLNVATGRLELAQEEYESEDLDAVSTALKRMETLVEDLLTLARQGQPIDETERVTLSTVAEQCWEVVDTHDATLTVDSEGTFRADPDRLQQLLENLFRNAVEHGGETVAIRVGILADGDGFYVADDGPGIPEDERENVFESGYSTTAEGTGFGLAIAKEIVDAHGWNITVTESQDGGARFEITDVELTG